MEGEYNGDQLTVELTEKQARMVRESLKTDVDTLQAIADKVGDCDTLDVEETLLGVSDILTEGLHE